MGGVTTIHGNLGTGDIRRVVGQQEDHERRDLVSPAGPAQRGERLGGAQERRGRPGQDRGVDLAGVDDVDPDPPARVFERGDAGQAAQRPLARGVGDRVVRGERRDRPDVHDRGPGRHQRRQRLHAEHRTGEVHRERPVPVGDRDLVQARTHRDTGVVHQAVHRPVPQPVPQRMPVLDPRHIEVAVCHTQCFTLVVEHVGRDDLCPFGRDGGRLGGALPTRRAGHDDGSSREFAHVVTVRRGRKRRK